MDLKEVAWQGVPPPVQTPIAAITDARSLQGTVTRARREEERKKSSALTHAMLCYVIVVVDLVLIAR
jgi:hypothetical protein